MSYTLHNSSDNSTSCVSFCPDGYYSSGANLRCVECLTKHCKVCAPEMICWTCLSGFFRGRQACMSSCPVGQFMGQDFLHYYQCMSCPQPCLNCSSVDTCSNCAPPYVKVSSPYPDVSETTVQKALHTSCVLPINCPTGTFYNSSANVC